MPRPKASDKPVDTWADAAKVMGEFSAALAEQQKAAAALSTFFATKAGSLGGAAEGGSSKRKKKHAVVDGKPKRPRTSYICFMSETMSKIKVGGR